MITDTKPTPARTIILVLVPLLLAACGVRNASPAAGLPSGDSTGVYELDAVISAALSGDPSTLAPYFEYTQALCTTEQGLGGPPKCLPGEHDGTPVNVLPFLGPGEGSFIRELDAPNWAGPHLSRLYAAYKVSDAAYSDPNYPAGEYALVFATAEGAPMPVTLQVTEGRIVRMDFGNDWPPHIPPEAVAQYLVSPR